MGLTRNQVRASDTTKWRGLTLGFALVEVRDRLAAAERQGPILRWYGGGRLVG
jgi:hypothetical protein